MKNVTQDYIDKEEAEQRKPAELYHFWRDGGEHWRYTDGDIPVTFDGSQLEVTTMSIKAAYVENPVLEFIATNPVEILWISAMKLHRDQAPLEASVIFLGQIKGVSFKGISANVNCVGFEHFLKQTVPRWRYQPTCNHIVFDSKCTLVAADYKITAAVTLDSTKTKLTSATFDAQEDGYFTGGGKVVFGDETRTVTDHTGAVLTLMYKFKELEDNDSVDAYPGCDGKIETCKDKFDNILNHLGFSHIPVENPALRVSW
jgi:uncharacterized phage protein (TIGR02218 family)